MRAAGVVSGAAVIIRVESGSEQRVTTGPDGRFSVDVAEARDVTVIVRAGGFAEKSGTRHRSSTRPLQIVLAPAQLLEQVTVTATRTEQRLGDIAGERQRAARRGDQEVAGRRRRRRAAADSDVQPVPPHEQPVVASDRAGRVAARHRAERRQPHAGAARRRARSTIRSAAGCTGRACRSRASIASRWSTDRARACTATTRWAASSTS